jgi:hypothetical protein
VDWLVWLRSTGIDIYRGPYRGQRGTASHRFRSCVVPGRGRRKGEGDQECFGRGEPRNGARAHLQLASVEGLSNYGSPRFWPRCEGELVGSIHIHLAPSPSAYDPSKPSGQSERDRNGQTIYSNAGKVVSRVEKVLKGKISGLSELVIQVEGGDERPFCTCSTGR